MTHPSKQDGSQIKLQGNLEGSVRFAGRTSKTPSRVDRTSLKPDCTNPRGFWGAMEIVAPTRGGEREAVGPNDVWAMDFVHDQLALGKKLRILTVVDTHSRLCPVVDPRFSYRGKTSCRRSNGPVGGSDTQGRSGSTTAANLSLATSISGPMPMTSHSTSHGLGKPTDNGCIEAFNSKLRAECLRS